jgi:ribosome biogenesis GTPase
MSSMSPDFNFPELITWGWSDFFSRALALQKSAEAMELLSVARIVSQHRDQYDVVDVSGQLRIAHLRGKLRHQSMDSLGKGVELLPTVGDWVLYEKEKPAPATDTQALELDKAASEISAQGSTLRKLQIETVLTRRSWLARTSPEGRVQSIAANIDYVFVATSLNQDLNYARLDRYVSLAWAAGATPIILLTKKDLDADWGKRLAETKTRLTGVEVFAISSQDPQSLEGLSPYFALGSTSVIVGSSGIGKSTLINALVGGDVSLTSPTREEDDKGRHTTTARSVWRTKWQGLIIDTPGMREIQMLDSEAGIEEIFADVYELFQRCRFRDCRHESEPACGIKTALADGSLTAERWQSFNKLEREIAYQKVKTEQATAAAKSKLHKKAKLK